MHKTATASNHVDMMAMARHRVCDRQQSPNLFHTPLKAQWNFTSEPDV
jgi:hypothetical protein